MKTAYWCPNKDVWNGVQIPLQFSGYTWKGLSIYHNLPFFDNVWIFADGKTRELTWSYDESPDPEVQHFKMEEV